MKLLHICAAAASACVLSSLSSAHAALITMEFTATLDTANSTGAVFGSTATGTIVMDTEAAFVGSADARLYIDAATLTLTTDGSLGELMITGAPMEISIQDIAGNDAFLVTNAASRGLPVFVSSSISTLSFNAIELALTNGDGNAVNGVGLPPMLDLGLFASAIFQVSGMDGAGEALSGRYVLNTLAVAQPSEVPIPGALVLMLSGVLGLGFAGRRKSAPALSGSHPL